MKRRPISTIGVSVCISLGLPLLLAGCGDRGANGSPPTEARLLQQNKTIMSDPHVPDSVKNHLADQQAAAQAAAKGYAAELRQKQGGSK